MDSGAALSVLPHDIGLQLGYQWNQQSIPVQLGGNLAACEARAVLTMASVGSFPPAQLAFAWADNDNVPLLLGQMNFFLEFDICFYRSRSVIEVAPKSTP